MNQSYPHPTQSVLFPEAELQYASFWERFGAAFLDGLILMIPNISLQYLLGPVPAFVFNIVMAWIYYALQESGAAQATIGKKAVGLKVCTDTGDRITFAQASGRFFGKYLSMIIIFIGYLMMLWDDRRQTLHDKLAQTFVVKQPA